MRSSAILVAIEGIDGCGKTFQTRLLQARAERCGLTAVTLGFPRYGKTLFARSIVDYLNGRLGTLDAVSARYAALLFAGDRLESLGEIQQLSRSHDLLILDRYVCSNLAYQGAKTAPDQRSEILHWIYRIEYEIYGLPKPDLNVFLDLPVALAARLNRQKGRRAYTEKAADLHEADFDYLSQCRSVYQTLAQSEQYGRWGMVPCTDAHGELREASETCEMAWELIEQARCEQTP